MRRHFHFTWTLKCATSDNNICKVGPRLLNWWKKNLCKSFIPYSVCHRGGSLVICVHTNSRTAWALSMKDQERSIPLIKLVTQPSIRSTRLSCTSWKPRLTLQELTGVKFCPETNLTAVIFNWLYMVSVWKLCLFDYFMLFMTSLNAFSFFFVLSLSTYQRLSLLKVLT